VVRGIGLDSHGHVRVGRLAVSFQIREIVLYGPDGQRRDLILQPGALNIITGDSKTGKSALSAIVDYCLGSGACRVPQGAIRRTVLWYGLRLKLRSGELFVARKAPETGKRASSAIFYELGDAVEIPAHDDLRSITNEEGLVALLSRACGIGENLHQPPPGQTREALQATIRHAVFFTFQEQAEIINRDLLFHRQGEPFIPQTIKDVSPYFLGAVDDNHLALARELRRLKHERASLERRLAEAESLRGEGLPRAKALLAEAQDAGLADPSVKPTSWGEVLSVLRAVSSAWVEDDSDVTNSGDALESLLARRSELASEYRTLNDELRLAQSFVVGEQGFAREGREQVARLRSVGLFKEEHATQVCPLCHTHLSEQVPSVDAIRQSLDRLERQLAGVQAGTPQVGRLVDVVEGRMAALRSELSDVRKAIDAIRRTNDRLEGERDDRARKAHVLGRIALYLESAAELEESGELRRELEAIGVRIAALEPQVSGDLIGERVDSALSLIARDLTQFAQRLRLEHSESPVRLDLRRLTVVADTGDGPVTMADMGSGENWVNYHIAAHLALHGLLIKRGRPVPRFLFLDQPSQVYFPPERNGDEGDMASLSSSDREAVERMFELIADFAREHSPDFQIVVTEHADLKTSWYQEAVRERWLGGKKLIPPEWLIQAKGDEAAPN